MKTNIKEKIIDVCERLFLQRGISDTGVAEIASAVGISKGTLYYHYASKDAIVDGVADRYFTRTKDAINQFISVLVSGVSIEHIITTSINVLRMKKTTEKMHYTLMAYGIIGYPPLKEKFKQNYEEWLLMIKQNLDATIPSGFNELFSHLLLAIIDGLAVENMLGMESIINQKDKALEFINLINLGD